MGQIGLVGRSIGQNTSAMHASRYCKSRHGGRTRLPGVPGPWRYVGAPSLVQNLRTCGVLRRFEESACAPAFSRIQARDHFFARARRRLELVLHGRYRGVPAMTGEGHDAGIANTPAYIGRKAQMFPQLTAAQIARLEGQ